MLIDKMYCPQILAYMTLQVEKQIISLSGNNISQELACSVISIAALETPTRFPSQSK